MSSVYVHTGQTERPSTSHHLPPHQPPVGPTYYNLAPKAEKETRDAKVLPRTPQPPHHDSDLSQSSTDSKPESDSTENPDQRSNMWLWIQNLDMADVLNWLLKILGVVFALLFGIWAPLSYKASLDGNRENNADQDKLSAQIDDLKEAADKSNRYLQKKLDDIAVLRAWEFCEGRNGSIGACATLSAKVDLDGLISSMAGLAFTSSAPSASPTGDERARPSGDGGGKSGGLDVVAVVGIAVAGLSLVVAGLTIGLKLWRVRKMKKAQFTGVDKPIS